MGHVFEVICSSCIEEGTGERAKGGAVWEGEHLGQAASCGQAVQQNKHFQMNMNLSTELVYSYGITLCHCG